MKNTFLNRVSAERRVLSSVNRMFPRNHQLTGLSLAAIDRWLTLVNIDNSSKVRSLLISLSENCQRLSDRSNETFLPIDETKMDSIEEELDNLRADLARQR